MSSIGTNNKPQPVYIFIQKEKKMLLYKILFLSINSQINILTDYALLSSK